MAAFFSRNAGDRCATCEFWAGPRALRSLNTEVEVESPTTKATCKEKKVAMEAEDACPTYRSWAMLK